MKRGLLEGRVALVTGASAGIGQAVANGFAAAGARVVAVARNAVALNEMAVQSEGAILACPCDLTSRREVAALPHALDTYGRLDILVHSAGVLGAVGGVAELDPHAWRQAMDVNMTATFDLLQALDPWLRRAPAGRALFLTSAAATIFNPGWSAYSASKAGFEALVRIYALETASTPLRSVLIDPGPMRTQIRAQAFPDEDPSRLPTADAILPMMLDLARDDRQPPIDIAFRDWFAVTP